MKKDIKLIAIPTAVAIVTHVLVFLGAYFHWFGVSNGTGGNFCEISMEGFIKQPANTLSNFAFMIAGLVAAWQLFKGQFDKNNNPLTQTLFFPVVMTVLMILLSPGSMAMHATETTVGGYFDMLSMYLIASIMFSYAFFRFFNSGKLGYIGAFIFTMLVCHYFHFTPTWFPLSLGYAGSFIFGVFTVTAMLLELGHFIKNKPTIQFKWAILTSVTFLTSFGIWQIGWDEHPWCIPDSLVQAHAVWHILDALAIYFVFRLYASENRVETA